MLQAGGFSARRQWATPDLAWFFTSSIRALPNPAPSSPTPLNISNIRIGCKYLLKRAGKLRQLRSGVDLSEKLLHDRGIWISEAQKLIIIAILMTATQCQSKPLIAHRDIPPPILGDDFLCLDSLFGKFLDEILSKALTP
jgi:hypothetical protein